MKKINSNGFAGRYLGAGILTGGVLPLLARAIDRVRPMPWLAPLSVILFYVGVAVIGSFIVLLTVEFAQDRRIRREYEQTGRFAKVSLSGGGFECQACGNRHVNSGDERCPLCGVVFRGENR